MTPPVLRLSGASAFHGQAPVLRGLDLTVNPGEAVALLGRNGAGKTTLAHAVLGLGPGRSGLWQVMRQDVSAWPTFRIARLGVALVPQGRGMFPGLTVHQVLRLSTLHRRLPVPDPWTLDRVLALFPSLRRHQHTPAQLLSGGERQMLAIARALLCQPRLLILDEPGEGLAPGLASAILLDTISTLNRDGLSVLLIEQDLRLAAALCPRAVVLANGGIAFDGTSADLLTRPDLVSAHLGLGPVPPVLPATPNGPTLPPHTTKDTA